MAALQTSITLIARDGNMVLETSYADPLGNSVAKTKVLCTVKEFAEKQADLIKQAESVHKAQVDLAMQAMYIANEEIKALSAKI